MSLKQRLNKMGATPGKLALIGVLALALVIVIVKQLPESALENASTRPVEASKQLAKTEKTRPTNLTAKDLQQESELPPWPEIDLTETLTNDPFAPPSWAVQQETPEVLATNEGPGELAELQEQGTSIVVIGQATKSATIGEQKLYVGDILEGFRVTDITTQGIFLNKLDPR